MNIFDLIKSQFAGNNIQDLLLLASNAREGDNHELAIHYFKAIKKVLNERKSDEKLIENISYLLADSYRLIKKLDDAEEEIKIAYSINPENETTLLNYSWIKIDKEEYNKAIKLLDKAISLNSDNSEGYFYRGVCYGQLRELPLALADFEKSVVIKPESEEGLYNIGYVYQQLEDYKTAIEYYNKAIEIAPLYTSAYVSRGNSRIKLGQKELACADFHQALELGEIRVKENIDEFCNK